MIRILATLVTVMSLAAGQLLALPDILKHLIDPAFEMKEGETELLIAKADLEGDDGTSMNAWKKNKNVEVGPVFMIRSQQDLDDPHVIPLKDALWKHTNTESYDDHDQWLNSAILRAHGKQSVILAVSGPDKNLYETVKKLVKDNLNVHILAYTGGYNARVNSAQLDLVLKDAELSAHVTLVDISGFWFLGQAGEGQVKSLAAPFFKDFWPRFRKARPQYAADWMAFNAEFNKLLLTRPADLFRAVDKKQLNENAELKAEFTAELEKGFESYHQFLRTVVANRGHLIPRYKQGTINCPVLAEDSAMADALLPFLTELKHDQVEVLQGEWSFDKDGKTKVTPAAAGQAIKHPNVYSFRLKDEKGLAQYKRMVLQALDIPLEGHELVQ